MVADREASYTIVTSTGDEYVGKVLAFDRVSDLALVQTFLPDGKTKPDNFRPLSFVENTSTIAVGDFVIATGNALAEFQNTLTF